MVHGACSLLVRFLLDIACRQGNIKQHKFGVAGGLVLHLTSAQTDLQLVPQCLADEVLDLVVA